MGEGFEAIYDAAQLHPYDLMGILIKESIILGLINNFPIRRTAVPFDVLEIYAGNDRRLRVYVKDGNLDIISLAGATGVFTVKQTKSGTTLITKTTGASGDGPQGPQGPQGILGSTDQGELFFYLYPYDTQSLSIGQYVYDVKITLADGTKYTVAEGVLNLLQPVN